MITKEIEGGKMFLLPPAPDKCQTCAREHDPRLPHDATTLYYQTAFNMEHGRAPTWIDAMEHCEEDIRVAWQEQLTLKGIDWAAGQVLPPEKSK